MAVEERRRRPGGVLSTRPLHFIWICDRSGSMGPDGKLDSLNQAIREALPLMKNVATENPNAQVLIRAIEFSDGAQWHISKPVPVEDFEWTDLDTPGGLTDMGAALSKVAEQMKMPPMDERGLPPVLVLLSDGSPSDDWEKGLQELMEQPWGQKAVRVAVAIGRDADHGPLKKFTGSDREVVQANNPEALVRLIKWVSTVLVQSVSSPASQSSYSGSVSGSNVPIPEAPDFAVPTAGPLESANDVW